MKRIFGILVVILLALVGTVLIFYGPLETQVIHHLSQTTYHAMTTTSIRQAQKQTATYNFKSVKAVSVATVSHAATRGTTSGGIGQLAIPSIKMKLPIFKGLSNDHLSRGAGTMKPKQKMGRGNYALAGHYMTDQGVLFSPLKQLKVGAMIYITNLHNVYRYQVTTIKTIHDTEVGVIADQPQQKLITLITCASATEGETNRIWVQGRLTAVTSANKQTLTYFQ